MADLTSSSAAARAMLAAGQLSKARVEIHQHFMAAVRRVYESTLTKAPTRYAKVPNWETWSRGFYILSVKADKAFQAKDVPPMLESLAALRAHFHKLHESAGMLLASDVINAFNEESLKAKPSLATLKRLRSSLDRATPPKQTSPENYAKARRAWAEAVDPVLSGSTGETLPSRNIKPLREAAASLDRVYGQAFE